VSTAIDMKGRVVNGWTVIRRAMPDDPRIPPSARRPAFSQFVPAPPPSSAWWVCRNDRGDEAVKSGNVLRRLART
jgi:hypothetical protein